MNLSTAIELYMDQNDISNLEGSRGVNNLNKIANALGYSDPLRDECGPLLAMLEDNSGAIEAIIEWLGRQRSPEMLATISSQIEIPEDEED